MTNVSSFELAVLAPNKGKPGTLIATRTVYADTVSAAVAKVRQEVEGTGFIVVQAASLKKEPDVSASVKAICDKLGINPDASIVSDRQIDVA